MTEGFEMVTESEVRGQVDAGDVYIHPLPVEFCERCEDELGVSAPATKILTLDIRGLGQGLHVGIYCDICVEIMADRLRNSLPAESK